MGMLKISSRLRRSPRHLWTAARSAIFISMLIGGVFWFERPDLESGDQVSPAKFHRRLLETASEQPNSSSNASTSDPLFPTDLFTSDQRRQGAVILHVLGIVYMFYALALVCDEFFVPSLDVIAEKLEISPDVAGATFMAAGGSAPELFTSVIGVFIAMNDVGIGTIVGSAVFNILFVIAACAFAAKEALKLTAWPLVRDVCFYSISLILLVVFFKDNLIHWWEALILFLWYGVYVSFMKFNEIVEDKLRELFKLPPNNREGQERGVTLRAAQYRKGLFHLMNETINPGLLKKKQGGNKDPLEGEEMMPLNESKKEIVIGDQVAGIAGLKTQLQVPSTSSTTDIDEMKTIDGEPSPASPLNGENADQKGNDGDDDDNEQIDMSFPKGGGWTKIFVYLVSFPIMFPLYVTLPDTKNPARRKYFILTFLGSIIWIAGYSYLMVWWATVTGDTIGIPSQVMGLTFLAAGTSVPDLITSVLVAKQGKGDMAVSSSVGSNIFDVTVGLPLPWLLYTIINFKAVTVDSQGVGCSVSLLFLMLIFVFLAIVCFNWQMTKGMGIVMLVLYVLFVIVTLGFSYNWYSCPI